MKLLSIPLLLICLYPTKSVYAHGFGERYDLPVPLWLYIWGAAAVVLISFLAMIRFLKRPRDQAFVDKYFTVPRLVTRIALHNFLGRMLEVIGVAIFLGVVVAGFIGSANPNYNVAPTLLWVIWWVGFAYLSAILGNLWIVINPWNTLYKWSESIYHKVRPNRSFSLNCAYPSHWGVWPAVVLFIGFAWFELAYAKPALPIKIATATLGYSLITWLGMAVYGRSVWLRTGECFSVVFGLLARFSPTECHVSDTAYCKECSLRCEFRLGYCRDCPECLERASGLTTSIKIRAYGSGLLKSPRASNSMTVFILVLLSTVTYDGLMATPFWRDIYTPLFRNLHDPVIVNSIGLLLCPIVLILGYLGTVEIMNKIAPRQNMLVAQTFVVSLIPIALAYHFAHYFSFLLIQGQLIIPLLSDPFGFGWDVLNTANYRVDIGIIGAEFVWMFAVITIVLGHMLAVYISHYLAFRLYEKDSMAIRSQLPMLVLMLAYTMLSLWIIAQPIIEV